MDKLYKGTARDGMVRIIGIDSTDTVMEAQRLHKLSNTGIALLGRMLTGGAMMASMLKNDKDKLTLNIKGDGPAINCLVTASRDLKVKGYVGNPDFDIERKENGKLNVSGALGGNSFLTVIMDMGLKEPYVSTIPTLSGEIAEDLAYYYTASEQTPSAVGLSVLVDGRGEVIGSGGFIVQMMPGADDLLADLISYRIAEMPALSDQFKEGKTIMDTLNFLFDDMDMKISEEGKPEYLCDCSRERVEKALVSLGLDELKNIARDEKEEELVCHFCNKKYIFQQKEIQNIIDTISKN